MSSEISGLLKLVGVGAIVYAVYTLSNRRGGKDGFVDAGRCGVGLAPCRGMGVRCINGYCRSDRFVALPPVSDLPMVPDVLFRSSPADTN